MNIVRGFVRGFLRFVGAVGDEDEYIRKYIQPEIDRAHRFKVPAGAISAMIDNALDEGDRPEIYLRQQVDQWVFGELTTRARSLGVPHYIYLQTWNDIRTDLMTPIEPLEALALWLDKWEAGNIVLI